MQNMIDLSIGDRVRLLEMDDPDPIPVGSEGTITSITPSLFEDDSTKIGVDWDNGRKLSIITPPDRIQKTNE